MPFKKGISGNEAGRPKGSKNKASEAIRIKIESFINEKIEEIDTVWQELEPKDKMTLLTRLLDYSIPKLKSQELNIEFEKLNDEDLKKIVSEILNNIEDE